VVGDSYLRLCDSAEYALNAIQDEMVTHGTLGDAFVSNNCGLDGSYGEYQFEIGRSIWNTTFCTEESKIWYLQTVLLVEGQERNRQFCNGRDSSRRSYLQ
jgi:hypothetical protein